MTNHTPNFAGIFTWVYWTENGESKQGQVNFTPLALKHMSPEYLVIVYLETEQIYMTVGDLTW